MTESTALTLPEIRKSRQLKQQALADKLSVNQAEISKLERRDDMYLSTLQNYVRALGGNLEVYACFPGTEPIRIKQFDVPEEKAPVEGSSRQSVATIAKSATEESGGKRQVLAIFRDWNASQTLCGSGLPEEQTESENGTVLSKSMRGSNEENS